MFQIELNKRREAELQKVKRDLEDQQLHHEQQIAALRKKNQDAQNELLEQIDSLNKTKSKWVVLQSDDVLKYWTHQEPIFSPH